MAASNGGNRELGMKEEYGRREGGDWGWLGRDRKKARQNFERGVVLDGSIPGRFLTLSHFSSASLKINRWHFRSLVQYEVIHHRRMGNGNSDCTSWLHS